MSFDQQNNSLEQYIKLDEEMPLIKEAQTMEEKLALFGYPSFKSIFVSLSNSYDSFKKLLANLNEIIWIKQMEDEKRLESIANQTKCNNDKVALENELNKMRNNLNSLRVKYEKLLQEQLENKKKMKDGEAALKSEKDQASISISRLINKENQFINEMKKKESYISKLLDQLIKLNDTTSKKGCNMPSSELYSSYNLNEKKSNTLIPTNKNPKDLFSDEMNRALSEKYQVIIQQNEFMKSALSDLNKLLIELTAIQKQTFMMQYKEAFGFDFAEENYDLSIANEYDLNKDTEKYTDQMKYLFIKLKEFVIRKDELGRTGDSCAGLNVKMSNMDNQMNKRGNIDQAYVINMMRINEYLKELLDDMSQLLKKMLAKEKHQEVPQTETKRRRERALTNSMAAFEYNNTIDCQLGNDKEMIDQQKKKMNIIQLNDELRNYIEILNTTEAFTQNQLQLQTETKCLPFKNHNDTNA